MKRIILTFAAAMLVSTAAPAATYVYHGNAWNPALGNITTCKKAWTPMVVTVQTPTAIPANVSAAQITVTTETTSVGGYTWTLSATKKRPFYMTAWTDPSGNINNWSIAFISRLTHTQSTLGGDYAQTKCGFQANVSSPGTWSRTN